MRHLVMHLESPMMAFGGETIDNFGVTRRFPSASMLTGMLANALGWRRTDTAAHQHLQDRLVFAARIDRHPPIGGSLHDFQTAQLGHTDRGWTTRGTPEGRQGDPGTLKSPHIRHRDYLADTIVTVALRLEPSEDTPDLDNLSAALQRPARPLFIGRKTCLPSAPIFAGFAHAPTTLESLMNWHLTSEATEDDSEVWAIWPEKDTPNNCAPVRTYQITDQRNWDTSGLHGGSRSVCEGRIPRSSFPPAHSPAHDSRVTHD